MSPPVVAARLKGGAASPTSTALTCLGLTASKVVPSRVARTTTPNARLTTFAMSGSSSGKVPASACESCVVALRLRPRWGSSALQELRLAARHDTPLGQGQNVVIDGRVTGASVSD